MRAFIEKIYLFEKSLDIYCFLVIFVLLIMIDVSIFCLSSLENKSVHMALSSIELILVKKEIKVQRRV